MEKTYVSPEHQKLFDKVFEKIKAVDQTLVLDIQELRGIGQDAVNVDKRRLVAYHFLKDGFSYGKIGRIMGGKTHAAVLNWMKKRPKPTSPVYFAWVTTVGENPGEIKRMITLKKYELNALRKRLKNLPALLPE